MNAMESLKQEVTKFFFSWLSEWKYVKIRFLRLILEKRVEWMESRL